MALFPAGGIARGDEEVFGQWDCCGGRCFGRLDCCGGKETVIMVSKMGEHIAKTQNKSALPKYNEI
jgi:hypothetical protein